MTLSEIPEGTLFWNELNSLHFLKHRCSLTRTVLAPLWLDGSSRWSAYAYAADAAGEFTPVAPGDWRSPRKSEVLASLLHRNDRAAVAAALPRQPYGGPKEDEVLLGLPFNCVGRVRYKNHRGEVAVRSIQCVWVFYGRTPWHPEPQWFVQAWDADKGQRRTFALKDFIPNDERTPTAS